jgi:hypothetical protein
VEGAPPLGILKGNISDLTNKENKYLKNLLGEI